MFAFDQFGPYPSGLPRRLLGPAGQSVAVAATYHRTHGVSYFHGCYSLADDQLSGINRRSKGGDHTLAALKCVRAARPADEHIYMIMDNLSANKNPDIRAWAKQHKVKLLFTPTNASWANPIEAQFRPCVPSPWAPRIAPTTPCRPATCRPT